MSLYHTAKIIFFEKSTNNLSSNFVTTHQSKCEHFIDFAAPNVIFIEFCHDSSIEMQAFH